MISAPGLPPAALWKRRPCRGRETIRTVNGSPSGSLTARASGVGASVKALKSCRASRRGEEDGTHVGKAATAPLPNDATALPTASKATPPAPSSNDHQAAKSGSLPVSGTKRVVSISSAERDVLQTRRSSIVPRKKLRVSGAALPAAPMRVGCPSDVGRALAKTPAGTPLMKNRRTAPSWVRATCVHSPREGGEVELTSAVSLIQLSRCPLVLRNPREARQNPEE